MNDRRRLFSLSGVFPLGVFVVAHLVAMARIGSNPAFSDPSKLTLVIETLLVFVPLAFHSWLGIEIAVGRRPGFQDSPLRAKWPSALMRITGVISLAFIAAHLWQFRIRLLLGRVQAQDFSNELIASLSSTGPLNVPYVAVGYLIGLAATIYHLAIGVQGACASFGWVRDEKQYKKVGAICTIGGLILFAIGASSVIHLATGANLV